LLCVTDYALNTYSFTTENCTLLGYYAVSSGNSWDTWPLKMEPIGCPKTFVGITTTHCIITQKSPFLVCLVVEAWNLAFTAALYFSYWQGNATVWCDYWV